MHKGGLCRHAVSVCLSRSSIMSRRINISPKFFHSRVATPFWFFSYQRKWHRDSEPISVFSACCWRCNKPGFVNRVAGGARPRTASCDTSLVVSDGIDCERRRRNIYDENPQRYAKDNRTAHLTARSDKSVACVTNNERLYSTFCTVEANY